MLSFLTKYGGNVHSQNGEDLIIQECIKRIPIVNKVCVEIGANDGYWMSNTAYLIEQGWTGLMVEADYNLYKKCAQNWSFIGGVRSQCCVVDATNINAFVDERCDVLSLDTDGSDYAIFQGLQARPKIVIVEIDSSIEPPSERFNSDGGASYWTMTVAGLEKGYFPLCHTGNLIFIDQQYASLFPECRPHPLIEWELYFNRSWLK